MKLSFKFRQVQAGRFWSKIRLKEIQDEGSAGRNAVMIKIILWDVDGTLLDFHAAEAAAVRSLFREFGFGECTDAMLARYSVINDSFWKRLERGEISRSEVLTGRYRKFFSEIGIDPEWASRFNEKYQLRLGDTIVYRDNSLEIIRKLRGKVQQHVVSNGTIVAQEKKLRLSGLGELMDGVFLSEQVGAEKPNKLFFDRVFQGIHAADVCPPEEILIVGDSLTSDIRGGINAGIRTCWYNPKKLLLPEEYQIDYEIRDLNEIFGIL